MSLLKLAFVAACLSSVVSCVKVPEIKTPDFDSPEFKIPNYEFPKLDIPLADLFVCEKKESEMPEVSDDVLADKLVVIDEIETQETEHKICGGFVLKDHQPVRSLNQKISIVTPNEVSEAAVAVKVYNHRTCHTITLKVTDKSAVEVDLNDMGMKVDPLLQVKDGANILTVTYLNADNKTVGEQMVYVDVLVHRPEIDGVRTVEQKNCPKE